MTRPWVALAILAGCGSLDVNSAFLVDAPPGADLAISVALTAYRGNDRSPPTVFWYGPDAISCDSNGSPGFWDSGTFGGHCVAGLTSYDGLESIVLILPGQRFEDTALAHELAHSALGVHDHPPAIFGPYPYRSARVGAVNDDLKNKYGI